MRVCATGHTTAAVVSTVVLAVLLGPAAAQQPAPPPGGVIIGGGNAPPPTHENCVEVEIGGEKSFSCLNQQMKRDVDRVNPIPNLPPLDAHSPDTRIGIVNIPAVQQQYGKNFGNSVIPFRPQAPTFSLPHR